MEGVDEERSLLSLVKESVFTYHDKVAVTYDDGKIKSSLTYGELWSRAEQISSIIRSHVTSNRVIGVCIEPTINLPSILLSVLQTSCSFYPFMYDGRNSVSRVLNQLQVNFLLVQSEHLQKLEALMTENKAVIIPSAELYQYNLVLIALYRHHVTSSVDQSDLAYCITTSGTTSLPKIVCVPHRCILPNILALRYKFEISDKDTVLLTSPLTFDPSIVDLFMTLTSGACLLIVPDKIKRMPSMLLDILCCRNHITVLQATPSLLYQFNSKALQSGLLGRETTLRILALGGEEFPPLSVINQWLGEDCKMKIYNLYGITEVSCWSNCCHITQQQIRDKVGSVPIGEPLPGTKVKVTDNYGNILSQGEGHLHIGSKERVCYVDDEIKQDGGQDDGVVWRDTGDIVELLPDGQIIYKHRTDTQIKRHGKRLNLLTIKKAASEVSDVKQSCVIYYNDRIYLYITSTGDDMMSVEATVTRHLFSHLPSHYQPDAITCKESLPITKHGKIDKHSLINEIESSSKIKVTMPTSLCEISKWLKQLWRKFLHQTETSSVEICDIDIEEESNFILVGGKSLQAVQLVDYLENVLRRKHPLILDLVVNKTFLHVAQYLHDVVNRDDVHVVNDDGDIVLNNDSNSDNVVDRDGVLVVGSDRLHIVKGDNVVNRVDNGYHDSGIINSTSNEYQKKSKVTEDLKLKGNKQHFDPELKTEEDNKDDDRTTRDRTTLDRTTQHRTTQGRTTQDRTTGDRTTLDRTTQHRTTQGRTAQDRTAQCRTTQDRTTRERTTGDRTTQEFNAKTADTCDEQLISEINENANNVHLLQKRKLSQDSEFDIQAAKHSKISDLGDDINLKPFVGSISRGNRYTQCDFTVNKSVPDDKDYHFTINNGLPVFSNNVHVYEHDSKGSDESMCRTETIATKTKPPSCVLQTDDRLMLTLLWKHDTGKCVDSSPLVGITSDNRNVVFIGSHSHHFSAVLLDSGNVIWEITLPDRIESSPCLSKCGRYVIVGCYDSCLYVINSATGSIEWSFQTGDSIKSSPVLDPVTSTIIFGSHDQCVYAVDLEERGCRWKVCLLSGSIFSSPCLHQGMVYIATLGGLLTAINICNGDVIWKYNINRPIFSSPTCLTNSILVSAVDGLVYAISYHGHKLWTYQTSAPIFSSPTICRTCNHGDCFVIGSHDNNLYCLDNQGQLIWSYQTSSPVYSTPFIFQYKKSFHWAELLPKNINKERCDDYPKLMRKISNAREVSPQNRTDDSILRMAAEIRTGLTVNCERLLSVFESDSGKVSSELKTSNNLNIPDNHTTSKYDCNSDLTLVSRLNKISNSSHLNCDKISDIIDVSVPYRQNMSASLPYNINTNVPYDKNIDASVPNGKNIAASVPYEKNIDKILSVDRNINVPYDITIDSNVPCYKTNDVTNQPCLNHPVQQHSFCACKTHLNDQIIVNQDIGNFDNGNYDNTNSATFSVQDSKQMTDKQDDETINIENSDNSMFNCVVTISTNGDLSILDLITGNVKGVYKLPGEVFSSPVVVGNRVLIGCRDNFLYCLQIT
ncbi:hypothetical protein SNE40_017271 [Patella caerulea]